MVKKILNEKPLMQKKTFLPRALELAWPRESYGQGFPNDQFSVIIAADFLIYGDAKNYQSSTAGSTSKWKILRKPMAKASTLVTQSSPLVGHNIGCFSKSPDFPD
jgi:hypothetical protein